MNERSEPASLPLDITPLFSTAFQSSSTFIDASFSGEIDYIIAPVKNDGLIPMNKRQGGFTLFHRDSKGAICSKLVVFLADSLAYLDSTKVINNRTFTGQALIIDENDNLIGYELVKDGKIIEKYVLNIPFGKQIRDSISGFKGRLDTRGGGGPGDCYDFGPSLIDWVKEQARSVGRWFKKVFSGVGGDDDANASNNASVIYIFNDSWSASNDFSWTPISPGGNAVSSFDYVNDFCNTLASGWEDDQLQAVLDGEMPPSYYGGYISTTSAADLAFRNKLRELQSNGFPCDKLHQMNNLRRFTEAAHDYYTSSGRTPAARDAILSVLYSIESNPTRAQYLEDISVKYFTQYLPAGFTAEEFGALIEDEALFEQVDEFLSTRRFSNEAVEYAKFLLSVNNDAKAFENPASGFCRKEDLYNFVRNNPTLCPNCTDGQLHDLIGTMFERAYNNWQANFMLNVGDYQANPDNTPNTFKAYSPLRGKEVVPDGFMKSIMNPAGIQLGVDQKAHWVECKASNKNFINLSDYEGQIGGEIDALANYQPWACSQKIAAITYVTTIDLTPAPSLVKTANSKGIWILNSYAFFKIENGKMYLTFSPAYPLVSQFGQTNMPTIAAIYQSFSNNYVEFK